MLWKFHGSSFVETTEVPFDDLWMRCDINLWLKISLADAGTNPLNDDALAITRKYESMELDIGSCHKSSYAVHHPLERERHILH